MAHKIPCTDFMCKKHPADQGWRFNEALGLMGRWQQLFGEDLRRFDIRDRYQRYGIGRFELHLRNDDVKCSVCNQMIVWGEMIWYKLDKSLDPFTPTDRACMGCMKKELGL